MIFSGGENSRAGLGRCFGHAAPCAFRQSAFDGRAAIDAVLTETHRQSVDQLTDVDVAALRCDVATDGLPFGERLDPRGRECRAFDAESGIDEDQAFRKQLR
jgi:hypothetical protein